MDSQDSAIRPSALLEAAAKNKRRGSRKDMNIRIRLHRMNVALTGRVTFYTPPEITPQLVSQLEKWESENPNEVADLKGLSTKKSDRSA